MHEGSDALVVRRKRALYRACHRGTKEMDWLLGRYAEARLPAMTDPALGAFEQLIGLPDPLLHRWIVDPAEAAAGAHASLVADIAGFAGLPAGRAG